MPVRRLVLRPPPHPNERTLWIEVVRERYRIVLHYHKPPRIIGTLTRDEIVRWARVMRKNGIPFEIYCELTGMRMIGFETLAVQAPSSVAAGSITIVRSGAR